jgi:hypothetical protein
MTQLGQGLYLSGIGILITFSALGILILVIFMLKLIFPEGAALQDSADNGESKDPKREALRKQAAAAGVAALLMHSGKTSSGLGKLLESPPGNWWGKAIHRIHNGSKDE